MYNLELLREVRDKVLMEPDLHKQEYWATVNLDTAHKDQSFRKDGYLAYDIDCGTTGCVAGWACMLSGDKAVLSERFPDLIDKNVYHACRVLTPNGLVEFIEDRGQALLGLSEEEAEVLFCEMQTRQGVLDLLDKYIKMAEEERQETGQKKGDH